MQRSAWWQRDENIDLSQNRITLIDQHRDSCQTWRTRINYHQETLLSFIIYIYFKMYLIFTLSYRLRLLPVCIWLSLVTETLGQRKER